MTINSYRLRVWVEPATRPLRSATRRMLFPKRLNFIAKEI
jgi:hypothetical protein